MKGILKILICVVVSSGCQGQTPDQESEPVSFLALGDSYTIGESVEESERWPVVLAQELRNKGFSMDDPEIIATTGWTTAELIDGINERGTLKPEYDLVSLLIGVNNQYRGQDFEIFEKEFRDLLSTAIALNGGSSKAVFVVSIPDYGVSPFGQTRDFEKIGLEIDLYNSYQKSVCDEMGIPLLDITEISRRVEADMFASDNLHPSAKMYGYWVNEVILDKVTDLIN